MAAPAQRSLWIDAATGIGRLVFGAIFLMAFGFKIAMPAMIGGQITAAGFPMGWVLVWIAALFELALALCFLTGAFFREASGIAAVYVLFLAFSFHGPSHWAVNQEEFGAFVSHFPFAAGLLFAAAHGPGRWAVKPSLLARGEQ